MNVPVLSLSLRSGPSFQSPVSFKLGEIVEGAGLLFSPVFVLRQRCSRSCRLPVSFTKMKGVIPGKIPQGTGFQGAGDGPFLYRPQR